MGKGKGGVPVLQMYPSGTSKRKKKTKHDRKEEEDYEKNGIRKQKSATFA